MVSVDLVTEPLKPTQPRYQSMPFDLESFCVCSPFHNLQAGGRRFETCTAHQ